MEITNSNYLWAAASLLYTAPPADFTSFESSDFDTTFSDLLKAVEATEETPSLAVQMANFGAETLGDAPDLGGMTSQEFLEHLVELQQELEESGVDVSDLADPMTLTPEELEELRGEMESRGTNPPPLAFDATTSYSVDSLIAMMSLNMVDYSSYGESLFEYI